MHYEYWETNGQWYWHLKHKNGRIVADGSEGYASKRNVIRAINSVKRGAMYAPVRER